MFLMLLASVPLAGLAWRFQRARRQAAAVATIRKLGGNVVYDYDFARDPAGQLLAGNGVSGVPGWLRRSFGHDFFHTARGVVASDGAPASAGDATAFWDAVAELPRLELIDACGKWVEPIGAVAALRNKTDLYYLALRSDRIGDGDLSFLKNLRNLYGLDLNGSRLTDEGLQLITELPRLGIADLRGTQISKHGIDDFHRAYPSCTLAHD
jgi:hypothetical protein